MYPLLQGLSVIEASSFVASPTAGLYLAQMGAEVIRVEQIGGGPDANRWPLAPDGTSIYRENLDRAKKSVAIDLANPEGRVLLQDLAAATGQMITNLPVNGFLSHDKLVAKRADMITVRVMGLADGGSALDYTVNSAVGFPNLTGVGDEPVNHVLAAWDLLTGAYAAFAMLAAVHHRTVTGEGKEVRIPLIDVAIGTVANLGMLGDIFVNGKGRDRLGNSVYGTFGRDFVTADGTRLMLVAITPRHWAGMVKVLGIETEIAAIEAERGVSFSQDDGARFNHRDALFPLVEAKIAARRYNEISAAFDANGCCYGKYRTMVEAAHDPVLVGHNPIFGQVTNANGQAYPAAGSIASIPQLDRLAPASAPALGAHTDEILERVLGLPSGAVAALHDKGLIGQA